MSSKPPIKSGLKSAPPAPHKSGAATAFIADPPRPKGTVQYPWEVEGLRDDVTKIFNLRISERHLAMLQFIGRQKHLHGSQQKFCLNLLLPAIEAEAERLKKEGII